MRGDVPPDKGEVREFLEQESLVKRIRVEGEGERKRQKETERDRKREKETERDRKRGERERDTHTHRHTQGIDRTSASNTARGASGEIRLSPSDSTSRNMSPSV